MKKIWKLILCFVSTLEKHLQSKKIPRSVFFLFEIRHIRTKYVYFLFRLNFDFGFFTEVTNHVEQTVYLNSFVRESGFRWQFLRQSTFLNSPLVERSDLSNEGEHGTWVSVIFYSVISLPLQLVFANCVYSLFWPTFPF